jgi:hypothetical protein
MASLVCFLPFHPHPRRLGSDIDETEYWILDRFMQMGPDPSAARVSFRHQLKALYQ